MKTKKITVILLFLLFTGICASAQTAARPNALGVHFGKLEYMGSEGSAAVFKPNQDFNTFVGVSFWRYCDNNFDYGLNVNMGKISFKKNGVKLFNDNIDLFTLNVHYKFNNGYILREDTRLQPYINLGFGIDNQGDSRVGKDLTDVIVPIGIGLNIRLTDRWTAQVQSLVNVSVTTPLRNNAVLRVYDHGIWEHSIGISYNFAHLCKKSGKKPVEQAVAQAPKVSEETRKIFEEALQGIQFETGSDVIKPESFPILDKVVKVMKDNPSYNLEINGHTDNQGKAEMNMELSQKRAIAVQNYLVNKGIQKNRLKPQGFGETRPVADNATPEGRAKNRRVEFKVY